MSGILIPEDVMKKLQAEQVAREQEKKHALSCSQKYLQESIRQHFGLLRRELGHYEQTTHAAVLAYNAGIEAVLDQLRVCYEQPTAYSISNLSQYIDAWLEQKQP